MRRQSALKTRHHYTTTKYTSTILAALASYHQYVNASAILERASQPIRIVTVTMKTLYSRPPRNWKFPTWLTQSLVCAINFIRNYHIHIKINESLNKQLFSSSLQWDHYSYRYYSVSRERSNVGSCKFPTSQLSWKQHMTRMETPLRLNSK